MSIIPVNRPFGSDLLAQCVTALAEKYPFIQTETIGTSRMGKPLYALRIGHGPAVLGYNAAHHANEWITSVLLMRFVEKYCGFCAEDTGTGSLEKYSLYAMPMVNPDGVDLVTGGIKAGDWKANAWGVDLNSNYPAGWELARQKKSAQGFTAPGPRGYVGPSPLSEPESSALAAYTRLRDFALTLSLHTQGEEIYWRYRHYLPPGAKKIAVALQRASGYLCVDVPDEASHAGYRDWFIEAFNRPGFTIECGLGENPLPIEDFAGIYEKVGPMLWVPLTRYN
jgi:g-D-glutamyl-meso-diaminopimelate peptidase